MGRKPGDAGDTGLLGGKMKFKTDGIGFWVCHKNDFVICQFFFFLFLSLKVYGYFISCATTLTVGCEKRRIREVS